MHAVPRHVGPAPCPGTSALRRDGGLELMPGSLDSAARLGVLVSRWTGDSAERRLDHAHRVVGGKVEGAVNRGPSQGAHRQARDGGDVLPRQRQVSSAQGCRAPRSCREGKLLVRMVRT